MAQIEPEEKPLQKTTKQAKFSTTEGGQKIYYLTGSPLTEHDLLRTRQMSAVIARFLR